MIPKISVIVPSYNSEKYINKCLTCLTEQNSNDYEIIVIDDGSTDSSPECCDEWEAKYNIIRVIHQENKKLSGARNTGIKSAQGEYVLFVDVDDIISNDTINTLLQIVESKAPDLVMFGFYYYNTETNEIRKNEIDKDFCGSNKEFFDFYFIPTIDNEFFNAPWNKLIKRKLLVDNNLFFDETVSIFEDIIFAPRLLNICNNIFLSKSVNYYYHLRYSGNLLSGFYPDCYNALQKFYSGAIEYCNKYDNNKEQTWRINRMFVEKTLVFIKKIVYTKTLDYKGKKKLISTISNDIQFKTASKESKLRKKHRFMCGLIKRKLILLCYCLFKLKGKK